MFWLGVVVSLCYVPGVTGAYIATQWPVLAVLLSFGLLRSGPFTAFHAVGLAFVAYAAVRLPYSPTPYASVFGLWLIVIMGLSVWFGTVTTNMRGLYVGLAVGASVSSFLAVLQYFGWDTVAVATSSPAPAGLYVNSVQQGTVLALIAVALLSERMWLWMLPLAPGIFLAHSRGAWVALAVGVLGCYVRRLWVLGAVAVAGAFYLLTPLSDSDTMRMLIWHTAWDNLKWLGWGPGVFYTIALPQNGAFSLYPEYAHNDVLQLAFEYGLGALLPFVIVGYALWRTDVREWPVVLAFVAAGCYSMPLFMPVASFLALVAVGRVLRVHGLARGYGSSSRQYVVSGEWNQYVQASRYAVPVASHYSTKS
jgi:hypothetical protein